MKSHSRSLALSHALRRTCLGSVIFFCLLAGASAAAPTDSDASLEKLERSKWTPDGLKQIRPLLADDMLSVEYGFGAMPRTRRINMAFMDAQPPPAPPPGMEPPRFELSDFRFVHPSADTTIVSYHVKGLTMPFDAYATSVWARRAGKWITVFYQATLTAPDAPGLNDFLPQKSRRESGRGK